MIHLVASVGYLSVCILEIGVKDDYYQSEKFVCVSVIKGEFADNLYYPPDYPPDFGYVV